MSACLRDRPQCRARATSTSLREHRQRRFDHTGRALPTSLRGACAMRGSGGGTNLRRGQRGCEWASRGSRRCSRRGSVRKTGGRTGVRSIGPRGMRRSRTTMPSSPSTVGRRPPTAAPTTVDTPCSAAAPLRAPSAPPRTTCAAPGNHRETRREAPCTAAGIQIQQRRIDYKPQSKRHADRPRSRQKQRIGDNPQLKGCQMLHGQESLAAGRSALARSARSRSADACVWSSVTPAAARPDPARFARSWSSAAYVLTSKAAYVLRINAAYVLKQGRWVSECRSTRLITSVGGAMPLVRAGCAGCVSSRFIGSAEWWRMRVESIYRWSGGGGGGGVD